MEAGEAVKVYYNPDDESKSVIDVRKVHYHWLAAFAFFALFGVLSLIIGIKKMTGQDDD